MRFILAILFALICLTAGAGAAPRHGVYASGVSCPYANDNGCLSSKTYASAPFFQDTAFVYNYASSGQLPTDCINSTTCTINTNAITNLNALYHQTSLNLPYIDYPIGSNNPATLAAVNTISDGTCTYNATGASYGSFPAVICQQNGSSPVTETISGYDFTNAGSGTGTSCVQLWIKPSNTANSVGGGTSYVIQNSYWKVTGGCFAGAVGPGNDSVIYLSKASATYQAPDLRIYNITCDGNFANSPDTGAGTLTGYISGTTLTVSAGTATAGDILSGGSILAGTWITSGSGPTYQVYPSQTVGSSGSQITITNHKTTLNGRMNCLQDNRAGTFQWPRTMLYSLVINFGHIPMENSNGGDNTIKYSAFINNCLSLNVYCHGEVFEDLATTTYRNTEVTGTVQVWGGGDAAYNTYQQATTPLYFTSGVTTGVVYGNLYVKDNLIIDNLTNCANAPPYTPANACTGVGNGNSTNVSVSRGFFDLDGTSYVNSLTVTGNVVAAQGSFSCVTRINDSPGGLTGAVLGVLTPGVNFTVTTRPTNYTVPQTSHTGIFPGMLLKDTNATDITNGWTDTTVQTFAGATAPAFTNTGTLCSSGGTDGAPGNAGGVGCGSMILNASEPVTTQSPTYFTFMTAFNALSWSNNWSVGGAYGATARAFTSPGYGSTTNSWDTVACP
jgi:hypothetical protein